MKTSKVLKKAIELIEKHGWVQHTYGSEASGYCLMGAIRAAIGEQKDESQWQRYRILVRRPLLKLMSYNDRPTTTQNDVLNILRTLHARALKKGL